MRPILYKILLGILTFVTLTISAQIETTSITPEEAIKQFVGSKNVEISNITFKGQSYQLGSFNFPNHIGAFTLPNQASQDFDIEKGIILTSGDVRNITAEGKSKDGGTEDFDPSGPYFSRNTGSGSDPDLLKLTRKINNNSYYVTDQGVLQFDFKSIAGGQVEFEFIFGSHEYPEFAPNGGNGSQHKFDVFAFLVKGSGITPDPNSNNTGNFYADGYKNLALVPGTTDPISVYTIYSGGNYSQYYQEIPIRSPNITFQGCTRSLKIKFDVVCGEVYTVKLAIADVNDHSLDSYVFLKAKSFVGPGDVGELTIDPGPYCAGITYNLNISGSNNFQYKWYDNTTGKQKTIVAANSNEEYWVDITDPITGCTIRKKIRIGEVYTNPNDNPYVKGMDNTYFYTKYVNADQQVCFDITGYDDQSNELVKIIGLSQPNGSVITGDEDFLKNPQRRFCWTPNTNDIGVHEFSIKVIDNNPCSQGQKSYIFKIIVVCPNCPIDVYIENKSISGVPVADEVVAAQKIEAGLSVDPNQTNGDVILGSGEKSVFKAGVEIKLQPGFIVQPGADFKTIIEPLCLVKDYCDTCCKENSEFTGQFGNAFSPNGDGINDFWQVVDFATPDCAYNIIGYELRVFNSIGLKMYEDIDKPSSGSSMECCKYKSIRDVNDNSRISSIHWDGHFNRSGATGKACCGETFLAVLTVYDCRGNKTDISLVIQAFADPQSPPPMQQQDSSTNSMTEKDGNSSKPLNNPNIELENKLVCMLFPNPSNGKVNIRIDNWPVKQEYAIVQVFDNYGRLLKDFDISKNNTTLDMSNLANGVYTIKIAIGNYILIKNTILQK